MTIFTLATYGMGLDFSIKVTGNTNLITVGLIRGGITIIIIIIITLL